MQIILHDPSDASKAAAALAEAGVAFTFGEATLPTAKTEVTISQLPQLAMLTANLRHVEADLARTLEVMQNVKLERHDLEVLERFTESVRGLTGPFGSGSLELLLEAGRGLSYAARVAEQGGFRR